MNTLKWIVLVLALFQGGWLVFDGTRAIVIGNYVTPTSGPRAGQLGPWSHIVSAVGLDPRSTPVKCLHLFLGAAWLAAMIFFAVRPENGWMFVLGCAIATLWYLPIGTVTSLIVLVLLFVMRK